MPENIYFGHALEITMSASFYPEIGGDVSFTLFELLHMEIVQYFQSKCSDDSQGEVTEKLEKLGFRVGQSVCELLMKEETRHMKDDKESVPEKTMKFVAKRMWQYLFNSSEHPHLSRSKNKRKDVFVLEDRQFRLLQRISAGKQYAEHAQLVRACHVLRQAFQGA